MSCIPRLIQYNPNSPNSNKLYRSLSRKASLTQTSLRTSVRVISSLRLISHHTSHQHQHINQPIHQTLLPHQPSPLQHQPPLSPSNSTNQYVIYSHSYRTTRNYTIRNFTTNATNASTQHNRFPKRIILCRHGESKVRQTTTDRQLRQTRPKPSHLCFRLYSPQHSSTPYSTTPCLTPSPPSKPRATCPTRPT